LAWSERRPPLTLAPLGFELPETGLDCMLCIACLEQRIGRKLNRDDFADCPVNDDHNWRRSQRLRDRLTRRE
jgi:hypothetical protein